MRVWGGRWGPGAEGRGLSGSVGWGPRRLAPARPPLAWGPPYLPVAASGPAPCPAELLCSGPMETGPELGASRQTGLPALSPPLPQSAAPPCPGLLSALEDWGFPPTRARYPT